MFGLAFLSKFDVVPLLLIIPFIIIKKYNTNVKSLAVLVLIFIGAFLVYKVTKGTMLDRKTVAANRIFQYFENPLYFEHDLGSKLSAGLNSLGFYGKMLLWPSKMVCYYGYNTLPIFSFTSLFALFGLAIGAGLLYVFIKRFKQPDMLWYGVLIFSGFISMYLNVAVPAAGVVAERFLFFSSIGFCLMVMYLFLRMKGSKPKLTQFKDLTVSQKGISVAVLLIFTIVIFNRNREWKSKAILFEADVKKQPESVKLSLLSTSQLIINLSDPEKAKTIPDNDKLRKIREAEELLKKAIKTDSSCGGCYNNLSFMYLTYERNPAEALPYLKLAYKRDSTKKEVICNIGISYFRLGQADIAEKYLLKAIETDDKKDFNVPFEVLQDLYSRTNIKKGIEFFKYYVQEDERKEFMNVLLAKTYFEARDTASSIFYYKEALQINPNNRSVSDFVTQLEVKFNKKNW
jgi:hypothetical protein